MGLSEDVTGRAGEIRLGLRGGASIAEIAADHGLRPEPTRACGWPAS